MKFESDGFLHLQVGDGPTARLDPLDCNDAIGALQAKYGEKREADYQNELCDLIESWGVTRPAKMLAFRIAGGIIEMVSAELGKAQAGPVSAAPGSPSGSA